MVTKRMLFERATRVGLTATGLVALWAACDRGHRDGRSKPLPPPAAPAQTSAPTPASGCKLAAIPTRVPITAKRVVAIGDVHGDLAATRSALKAAGAIDDKDRWLGGDLVVVQTGDILDRGDDEPEIIELLEKLGAQAKQAGGAVIVLNGNHELMNAARDFRYVTPEAMRDFGDREQALDPGGPWAKRLAAHNLVAIINDTVFSHAGVLPDWVTHVDEANLSSRCWLDGQAGGPSEPPLALTSDNSPVWTRAYGLADQTDCAQLKDALAKLGAKRMVVGHTVQQTGITSACDGALWRIDVGLAKGYGGPIEVLEVSDSPRVLKGTR
jgi:predicted house-cleaning NTP pyrophosphatase (Maf/HAM1 superfamily)